MDVMFLSCCTCLTAAVLTPPLPVFSSRCFLLQAAAAAAGSGAAGAASVAAAAAGGSEAAVPGADSGDAAAAASAAGDSGSTLRLLTSVLGGARAAYHCLYGRCFVHGLCSTFAVGRILRSYFCGLGVDL